MKKLIEVHTAEELARSCLADPILEGAVRSVLDKTPAADVDKLTSAEKQAIFRLGQMDMKESVLSMIREMADSADWVSPSVLIGMLDAVKGLEP